RCWWRRRAGCAGSPWSAGSSSGSTLSRTDLVADFLNSSAPHLIQHGDDIAMTRHTFGADGNFDSGICFMQSIETGHDFLVLNILPVEADGVTRANTDRHVILYLGWRRRLGRW